MGNDKDSKTLQRKKQRWTCVGQQNRRCENMKAYGPFTRYVVAVSDHTDRPCINYFEFDDHLYVHHI